MKIYNAEITIASDSDREKLFAEIDFDGVQFAEISQEEKDVRVEFYSHPSGKAWDFKFDEIVEILIKAKKRLTEEDMK